MSLRLITPPAAEPVSVETAKLFLRVDDTSDDTLITSLIKAAREKGEELSRRAFITQTWDVTMDDWPQALEMELLRPPLQSVTSVKYIDIDDVEHTVDSSTYYAVTKSEPGKLVFKSLEGSSLRREGAVTVRFVAGYGNAASDVPERIKSAILSLVAYWYENRESQSVPNDIKQAFVSQRVVWF